MSAALYERRETFTSGHWFGVEVRRAFGRDGGYAVMIGKGYEDDGGSWQPLPVTVCDQADAEMIARDLHVALAPYACREAALYEARLKGELAA